MEIVQLNLFVLVALLLLTIASVIAGYVRRENRNEQIGTWFINWLAGLGHEFAGALITGLLILLLVTLPSEYLRKNEEVSDLTRQARSSDAALARIAIEKMVDRGWFFDGTLESAYLRAADMRSIGVVCCVRLAHVYLGEANLDDVMWAGDSDLSGANFIGATMRHVRFMGADLRGAEFSLADLTDAILADANLANADLSNTILINTDFEGANLTGASLMLADLRGADLQESSLVSADLTGAIFDETTILPDLSLWTVDTDMGRFTNPD